MAPTKTKTKRKKENKGAYLSAHASKLSIPQAPSFPLFKL
jgi:hypothetical protein